MRSCSPGQKQPRDIVLKACLVHLRLTKNTLQENIGCGRPHSLKKFSSTSLVPFRNIRYAFNSSARVLVPIGNQTMCCSCLMFMIRLKCWQGGMLGATSSPFYPDPILKYHQRLKTGIKMLNGLKGWQGGMLGACSSRRLLLC